MPRSLWLSLTVGGLLLLARSSVAEEPKSPAAPAKPPLPYGQGKIEDKGPPAPVLSQEELEKRFAETMSGATMVGNFNAGSMTATEKPDAGKDDAGKATAAKPLKEDRYTLGKVAKIKDDYWLFETRIQYGQHDVTLPIMIQVKWAGDTPIITLTDLTIPGLGTFTARVLVYRDQYAGMWMHGDHGGQMFGRIVKANVKENEKK
jgi:hypothetical protein